MPIVALLTDFGSKDPYVGIMKAVILSKTEGVDFIDLGHDVDAQEISSAAYILAAAWEYLPSETVAVSVVDPGVGSERRVLCAVENKKYLICPDNGSAGLLIKEYPRAKCYYLAPDFHRRLLARKKEYSSTFDGRDVFAPTAAEVCNNGFHAVMGKTAEPVGIGSIEVIRTESRTASAPSRPCLESRIIHIDRFGNCISSITFKRFREEQMPTPSHLTFFKNDAVVLQLNSIEQFFSQVEEGTPIAYWGSAGYLELAVNRGSAARRYGLRFGDRVQILSGML